MTKEEYKELNEYLDNIFSHIEKSDYFFLENLELFKDLNNMYCELVDEYDIHTNSNDINLTEEQVYDLSHEIIENISPNYVEKFEGLKEKNELYFGRKGIVINGIIQMNDTNTLVFPNGQKIIYVKTKGNYSDVKNLVHEFIHYTSNNENNIKRYILGEFLSIYFEMYTEEYLKNKGITDESISSNTRIVDTYNRCGQLSWVIDPLIVYYNLKQIDINQIDYINENIMNISKEDFEEQCKELLEICRENGLNKDNVFANYNHFSLAFQYLFGTLLAFYAINNCKKDDIVKLNDHIDDKDDLFIIDSLQKIGIDLTDENILEEMFNCIEEYLEKQKSKRK